MTPELKAEKLKGLHDMMDRGSRLMARAMYEDAKRTMYFYLGYTAEEASMWRRFNRCCHAGRKIRIKERPVFIRMGKPTVSIRREQPSTPTDVTPA